MPKVLDGKCVAREIKKNIKEKASNLRRRGIIPTLGIVRVGKRPDDLAYERGIIKNCKAVDIESRVFETEEDISMEELVKLLKNINEDNSIHGILIFRPLPKHIDEDIIKQIISPDKDIDCMNPINLEKVFEGDLNGFVPCTPKAVVEILKYYNIPLLGSNVSVINRSMVVGRPLSMMLLGEGSTVTICHSKTRKLHEITSNADIVVTAVGKAKMFDLKYFSTKNVVIDVGINDAGNGKICGDVNYEEVAENVKAITPVPGGVGSVTTSILLEHVIKACNKIAL